MSELTINKAPQAFTPILEISVAEQFPAPQGDVTVEQYLKDCVAQVQGLKIVDMHDKEGYEVVRRARLDLGKLRNAVDKTGKAAREEANAYAKAVIAEANRLIAIVAETEKQYQAMEDKYNEEWAELERKKAEELLERYEARVKMLTGWGAARDGAFWVIEDPLVSGAVSIEDKRVMDASGEDEKTFEEWTAKAEAHWKKIEKARAEAQAYMVRYNILAGLGFAENEGKNQMEIRYHDYHREVGLQWMRSATDTAWEPLVEEIKARKQAEDDKILTKQKEAEAAAAAARESLRKTRQMVLDTLPEAGVEYCLGKKGDYDLADLSDAEFEAWVQEIKTWEPPTPAVGEIMEEVVEELRPEGAEYPVQEEVMDAEDEPQAPYQRVVVRIEKHYNDGSMEYIDGENLDNYHSNIQSLDWAVLTRNIEMKPVNWKS